MFILKHFNDLTAKQLYDILQLREAVFQLEQNCLYKDIDDKDKECYHLMHYQNNELISYARLVPKGISYTDYNSIGRVVSQPNKRKNGYGKLLMIEAMNAMQTIFPDEPIKISAQLYLKKFYESFGFLAIGESYLEDDIPHIAMIKD